MFTTNFDRYVCEGSKITCEVDGFTCTATLYRDDNCAPPWKREDGHGPVSDWVSRGKRPGERVLNADRGSKRYYDFEEAMKIARRDGWGVKDKAGKTRKQVSAEAVENDFKALKAWCNDEWHYFGVAVTVRKAGVPLTGKYDHAVWGIEGNFPGGDNGYFAEVANDFLGEALAAARAKLGELCTCETEAVEG